MKTQKEIKSKLKLIVPFLVLLNFSPKWGYSQFQPVYDLRTNNLITPVKDQGNCGSCWAFATIAAIESNWKKTGYGTYILSEDNVIDCHSFDEAPCYGGSFFMAHALFSRHGGTLLNANDAYTPTIQDCPLSQTFPPGPPSYNEEIRFLPKDTNIMKQALIDHGALATTMFFNIANYNSAKYKYYDNQLDATDSLYPHCVTLAGWNDTMTFQGAPGAGGWIIKDSYGTNWAQAGYFYVSYYDAGILSETAYFPNRQNVPMSVNKSNVYFHDTYGWVDNFGLGSNTAYGLVKYTISPSGSTISAQQIKRIGTYAVEDNTTIIISIYKSFSAGVLSGLITSQSLTCPFKGFYNFSFTLPSDSIGTDIYIKAQYQTPVGKNNPVPIEKYEANHTSGIQLSSNSCWVSTNGTTWIPTGQGSGYPFDLCIKMYTENAPKATFNMNTDSICVGGSIMFNDISALPKDSIRWLLNGTYHGNMPMENIIFNTAGQHLVELVVFSGNNNDTTGKTITVLPLPPTPLITQSNDSLFSSYAYAYQWYDNSGIIPGATSNYYVPQQSGIYFVLITDQYGCNNMSSPFNYIINNISEISTEDIKLFPNPFGNYLNIVCQSKPGIILLSDVYGQIILQSTLSSYKSTLYLQHLNSGIYYLHIITTEGRRIFKTLKL
ncbi:MAG TPA: C1 family peptidase [Bacteroidales bacterium]|nr:C1 family peptidase [Bacteroidales bacterium]